MTIPLSTLKERFEGCLLGLAVGEPEADPEQRESRHGEDGTVDLEPRKQACTADSQHGEHERADAAHGRQKRGDDRPGDREAGELPGVGRARGQVLDLFHRPIGLHESDQTIPE